MNEAEIIHSNRDLLLNSKPEFIDKCFNDFFESNSILNKEEQFRAIFDFGLEVSEAILDYTMNYEQYNKS